MLFKSNFLQHFYKVILAQIWIFSSGMAGKKSYRLHETDVFLTLFLTLALPSLNPTVAITPTTTKTKI